MSRQKIPGISLAVIRDGKIDLLRSYGFANVEHRVGVKPGTVFQSGSVAKQFTAAAVMLLVQDGRLSLDDTVAKYVSKAPSSWHNMTIRNLLNGTSGLGSFGDEVDLRRDYTEQDFLDLAEKSPLRFAPGTGWNYSNIAYVTLGILIRKITGKPYGDFLRERIFAPLGMSTARVISEEDIIPHRAAGYRLVQGELKNQEWVSPTNNTTADGSLYLSILDMIAWDRALNADFPLTRSSREQIWTPAVLSNGRSNNYGFGWHLGRIGSERIVFHGGAWQGFKAFIARVLDDKRTFIFFANSWDSHEFRLAQGLLDIYYPQLRSPHLAIIRDDQPELTKIHRHLLMQIADGTITPDSFAASTRDGMFPAKIDELSMSLRSLSIPVAVVHTSELVKTEKIGEHTSRKYLLSDVLVSWIASMETDRDGRIVNINMSRISSEH